MFTSVAHWDREYICAGSSWWCWNYSGRTKSLVFLGERIHQRGLGPTLIRISQFSVEALSEAIRFMLQPEVKSRATEIAALIENEDGVGAAVNAFRQHLPPKIMRQNIVPIT
ncbi:unnamed protein product [Fraxinus pennsylvanica]|uniref:Uncharacterized protein n=1 Tax=Fraxinus pennsylvanica TaxID=56036 RepID=A0AAD2E6J3_9LAMI|nr:unnamed protein product [Fraxinus pennsylvanica]